MRMPRWFKLPRSICLTPLPVLSLEHDICEDNSVIYIGTLAQHTLTLWHHMCRYSKYCEHNIS